MKNEPHNPNTEASKNISPDGITPPPIPAEATEVAQASQPLNAPTLTSEDDEENPEKPFHSLIQDGFTFSALGIGGLTYFGVSPDMKVPALLLASTLPIGWVVTRIEYGHEKYIQAGWGKSLWDKLQMFWSIRGGGFYGLVCVLYFAIPELARMKLTWPGLDLGDLIQWFLVDRFVNFATYSWQSFMWPYNWMADLGMIGMGSLVATGFGLFELTRAGARKFSSWLKRKKDR